MDYELWFNMFARGYGPLVLIIVIAVPLFLATYYAGIRFPYQGLVILIVSVVLAMFVLLFLSSKNRGRRRRYY